jgi:hypothetical protein
MTNTSTTTSIQEAPPPGPEPGSEDTTSPEAVVENSKFKIQNPKLPKGLHRYTLLAGLLIVFVGLVTFLAPTDPDVWWHLRNGKLIVESGIPAGDVYSFTAQGRPWLVQEWLTEVVMYGLKSLLGYGALSLLFGILQALGGLAVYLLVRGRGAGRILSLVLLMLYFVFATPSWGVRPQVLTVVFLGGFYLALTAYKRDPSRVRVLWLLPPAMALWANLHASYFMGIALVGAFIVGELANAVIYRPQQPTPIRPLFATLGACLLATLINPYFLSLWAYPLTYALNGTSNPLLRYTQEWQSPNFHEPINLLFALSLALLAVVGIGGMSTGYRAPGTEYRVPSRGLAGSGAESLGTRYSADITDALILVAFTLLGLQAVRLLPIYGVMVLPLLAGGLTRTWPALSARNEAPPTAREGRLNRFAGVVGAALVAYLVLTAPVAQTGPEPRTGSGFVYPVKAVDYLAKIDGPVRLYNEFAWGGYLIYRLYPQRLVFIDGRADMYREHIFDDFMTVQNVAPPWREVLARYNVNLAIIIPGSPLDYALAHEQAWKVAYKDDMAVIYRR